RAQVLVEQRVQISADSLPHTTIAHVGDFQHRLPWKTALQRELPPLHIWILTVLGKEADALAQVRAQSAAGTERQKKAARERVRQRRDEMQPVVQSWIQVSRLAEPGLDHILVRHADRLEVNSITA